MDGDTEVGRAIGRLAASTVDKILDSTIGALFLLAGLAALGRSSVFAVCFLVGGVVSMMTAWVLPATVITPTGFRRGRFLRLVSWSDVVTVYPPPAGGNVQVRLQSGKVVVLEGIKVDRLHGMWA